MWRRALTGGRCATDRLPVTPASVRADTSISPACSQVQIPGTHAITITRSTVNQSQSEWRASSATTPLLASVTDTWSLQRQQSVVYQGTTLNCGESLQHAARANRSAQCAPLRSVEAGRWARIRRLNPGASECWGHPEKEANGKPHSYHISADSVHI